MLEGTRTAAKLAEEWSRSAPSMVAHQRGWEFSVVKLAVVVESTKSCGSTLSERILGSLIPG